MTTMPAAAFALALLFGTVAPAAADSYLADPGHTSAEFSAIHLGLSHVRGTIPLRRATVKTAPGAPLPTAIEASFDLAGLDTHNERRDAELKSEHWLDVATYPTMTFRSTRVEGTDPKAFKVTGELTLHGVTKPVTLSADLEGTSKSRAGRTRLAYAATTTLDRHDFGVTYNGSVPLGDKTVGDRIDVTIEIELDEQP